MNMFRCRFCGWTQGGTTDEINGAAQSCPMCGADNVAEGYAMLIEEEMPTFAPTGATRLERFTNELNEIFGEPYGDEVAAVFQKHGKKRIWENPTLLWADRPADEADIIMGVAKCHNFAHPMTVLPSQRT